MGTPPCQRHHQMIERRMKRQRRQTHLALAAPAMTTPTHRSAPLPDITHHALQSMLSTTPSYNKHRASVAGARRARIVPALPPSPARQRGIVPLWEYAGRGGQVKSKQKRLVLFGSCQFIRLLCLCLLFSPPCCLVFDSSSFMYIHVHFLFGLIYNFGASRPRPCPRPRRPLSKSPLPPHPFQKEAGAVSQAPSVTIMGPLSSSSSPPSMPSCPPPSYSKLPALPPTPPGRRWLAPLPPT